MLHLSCLKQARFDGGSSYGGSDGNAEKLANLWYNLEIYHDGGIRCGLRKSGERKAIERTS